MRAARGSKDLIRAINRALILKMIKTGKAISRADLARQSGLSPATVTGITAELIDEGLVYEQASGDSSGGRPPILLAINPDGGYVVGIKLAENIAVGALVDLNADIHERKTLALEGRDAGSVVSKLVDLIEDLLHSAGISEDRLKGVGVGAAGVVNHEDGVLRHSPYFGWKDVPLRTMIQDRLDVSVSVDNDVNTLTLFEKLFGEEDAQDFLTITVGRGIGMGIVVNGQLYRGAGGGAGELGHSVVDPDGPVCSCGKRGCLETYLSEPALVSAAREAALTLDGHALESVDDLLDLVHSGNDEAETILLNAAELLGRYAAILVNVFDPGLIIFSGEGTRYGVPFFKEVERSLRLHSIPGLAENTQIRIDEWGDDAWARGAAGLALQELFEPAMASG